MQDLRLTPARAKLASILLFVLGMTVAGCGSGPAPTVAVQSPVDTVYAFFRALNSGDGHSAGAYLASDSMLSGVGDAAPAGLFTNLTCKPGSDFNSQIVDSATKAVVACEFDIREEWGGFLALHYNWGVWLECQPPGPWLVHDWGQPIGPW